MFGDILLGAYSIILSGQMGLKCNCKTLCRISINFFNLISQYRRFGLTYVNYTTLERFPKSSSTWFAEFASNNKNFGAQAEKSILGFVYREDSLEIQILQIISFAVIAGLLLLLLRTFSNNLDSSPAPVLQKATRNASGGKGVSYFEIDQTCTGDQEADKFVDGC